MGPGWPWRDAPASPSQILTLTCSEIPIKLITDINIYRSGNMHARRLMKMATQTVPWSSSNSWTTSNRRLHVQLWWARKHSSQQGERNRSQAARLLQARRPTTLLVLLPVSSDSPKTFPKQSVSPSLLLSLTLIYRYMNTHIRSDRSNRLLLQALMWESDKNLIWEVGQNAESHAPHSLWVKVQWEGVYVSHRVVLPASGPLGSTWEIPCLSKDR